MGFQGFTARLSVALLAVALSSCGGSKSSEPATATPSFSEGTGDYVGTQSITITDTDTSASIYYTTDGTTPTASSTAYVAGTPVSITFSLTLEAIAISSGHRSSSVASATYVITPAAIPTAGLWLGTDTVSGDNVIALINAAGAAIFIRSQDFVQYAGTLTVADENITSTLAGYTDFPATFADGSITGSGAFTGIVNEDTSIDGPLAFTSSASTSYPARFDLGYSPVSIAIPTGSTTVSSGAALVGTYTDDHTTDPLAAGTVTIVVNPTNADAATISSSGATSGCVMSGTIATADTTTDVYEVTYSYSGCGGAFSTLNGLSFSGLAALNTSVSPLQLLMAVNGPGGGATSYGLVSSLSLQ